MPQISIPFAQQNHLSERAANCAVARDGFNVIDRLQPKKRLIAYTSDEVGQKRMPMRPSAVLEMKRVAVREAVGRFRTANPRVFGSVLHGTDQDGSDIDLLVGRYLVRRFSIWAACKMNWNHCLASTSMY